MKHTNIILDCLCREIRRLRKENRKLRDKHREECRQIALYDDELQKAKCADAEQPEGSEKPKKTYKEDFLEKLPNARLKDSGIPWACRDNVYGIIGECAGRRCKDCWNEVMPDE